jgi:hypothetical protein
MMSDTPLLTPDYATWLHSLKARIQTARIMAARAAKRELILLYWYMRHGIVENQQAIGWGKAVAERLSADLQAEFPGVRDYTANHLWLMPQFYAESNRLSFRLRPLLRLACWKRQILNSLFKILRIAIRAEPLHAHE